MELQNKKIDGKEESLLKKFFNINLFGVPMLLFLVGAIIIILGISTNSIPIWKDYLGGGAILAFFVCLEIIMIILFIIY